MKTVIRPETEMKDSGITWIGNIPNDWNVRRLKYVLNERKEKNDPLVTDNILSLSAEQGVIPFSERIGGGNKPKEDLTAYKVVRAGDIVLNSMNVLSGAVHYSNYTGCVSPVYYMLYNENDIVTRYYNLVFQTEAFQRSLRGLGNGILIKETDEGKLNTIRMRIPMEKLIKVKLPFPSFDEMKKIVESIEPIRSQIDEIIAEAKASIDEYKRLRIAAVNDAVTHGIHNNAIKDSNVDWIGKIPDNWKIVITKRLFKIKKDIAGKEGYTVLSITQKGIVPKVFGGKGQFAADYSNYQLVNKGDFAMNHMDLLTGWLDISEYDGVTSPDYRVFVPTGYEDIYAPYYKYVMQNCYSCRIYYGLGHGVAGVGRWRLPADMFLNFKLPMPSKAEQKEIADFLDKRTKEIDSLIAEKESLINDLEAYKKSLIYEVVTGKRKVV